MRFKSRKTQTNCAPNYIQNTDILITLGNKSAKNKAKTKDLSAQSLTITSKVRFITMFFILTLV